MKKQEKQIDAIDTMRNAFPGLDALVWVSGPAAETAERLQDAFVELYNHRAEAYASLPERLASCSWPGDVMVEQVRFLSTMQGHYAEYGQQALAVLTEAFSSENSQRPAEVTAFRRDSARSTATKPHAGAEGIEEASSPAPDTAPIIERKAS